MAQQPDQSGRTDPALGSPSDAVNSAEGALKEAALQADTVVRNAANAATFGLADKADAAIDATLGGLLGATSNEPNQNATQP